MENEPLKPYLSFQSMLLDQAQSHPERTALKEVRDGVTFSVTYEALYERVRKKAEGNEPNPVRDAEGFLHVPAQVSVASLVDLFAAGFEGGRFPFRTSGTTASAREVILDEKAILRSAWNGEMMMHCTSRDRLLSLLPMTHIFGFVCTLIWPLSRGAEVDLGRGMRHLIDDPNYFRPTILPVVPTLLKFLVGIGSINPELKAILVGAGPCDGELLRAVQSRGIDVRFGYGLTETASGLAISLENEDPTAMALCPDTTLRLSEEGEILVRTPCMMEGYKDDPAHTAEKVVDGELRTGDIGEFDEKGRLHIRGRMDDVLVLPNGEKIYLPEWESKISALLGTDVVIALKDHLPVLIARAGTRTREQMLVLLDEFNREMPIGRKIRDLFLYEEDFPRTVTGKLMRWKILKNLQ